MFNLWYIGTKHVKLMGTYVTRREASDAAALFIQRGKLSSYAIRESSEPAPLPGIVGTVFNG